MRRGLRNIVIGSLLLTLSAFSSGCLIRTFFGLIVTEDISTFVRLAIDGVSVALCRDVADQTGSTTVECTYRIESEDGTSTQTSTAELLSELGIFGLIIDPVILQVPEGFTGFTGTYDAGAGAGPQPLNMTMTTSFPVQPGMAVTAEPGHKFLILELPDSVATSLPVADPQNGTPFDFAFRFDPAGAPSVAVKAMLTGRIVVGGETFYIPLFPCVTDFASIPALQIPLTPGQMNLVPALLALITQLSQSGNLVCNGQPYDFTSVPVELQHFSIE